jgi:hypothetical protein
MTYFTLVVAIAIAAVAAWYSIVGLMAIFAAAAIPIAIMGGVLEVGKLVTASWLYRNWKQTPFLLKTYLTLAVGVLMLITSMGIFGFLSKAHIDQGIGSGDASAKIERLDTSIRANEKEIQRAQSTLDSFDAVLDRFTELGYVTRGLEARQEQAEERSTMRGIIARAEAENDKLYDKRSELSTEVRAFEVEVGPIKYIADLIYENGEDNLDEAVRIVILLLIFVFDPLAVLLLIAANQSLVREQRSSRVRKEVWEAYQKVAEENKDLLAALDDGDTYKPSKGNAFNQLSKRPKEWLTKGKLVVDKDNISKL